jgi:hypothetical protein
MAQIDPNIALGFRMPQIQDPVAATARVQEIGVNALKMQELQRGIQEEQEVRNFLRSADLSKPETRAQLSQFGKTGLGYGKLLAEQEKAGLETKKLGGEISKQDLERSRERTSDLAFNPSDSNIKAYLEDSILRKEMTPEQAQGLFAQVANMPLDKRRDTFLQLGSNAAKRLEQMTVSAAQQQTADVTRRGQDIQAATTRRGQDITDVRAREGQAMQYDPQLQANIAEAKASGEFIGKNRATAAAALPSAIQSADEGIRLIDEMIGKAPVIKDGKVITKGTAPHPGFRGYVGSGFSIADGLTVPGQRFIEGSDTASFEVRQKQIEGKAFLEAFNILRGAGAITEKEGEKGTAAIMRMNKASNEKEYIAAGRELQGILRAGKERSQAKAGGASAAPSGGVIDFNTLK